MLDRVACNAHSTAKTGKCGVVVMCTISFTYIGFYHDLIVFQNLNRQLTNAEIHHRLAAVFKDD